ncbi:MAG: hypothetical protein SRB2_00595 [Desulfobacteraceae bacterium Eth-SRB2]|nr:MAG: hypothetical protein SRB2_00595 [Desulfobacteraceae bacterium Eth-SRB2]
MVSSLPLTLINTVLYFSYLFINFLVTFFKHRNSLIKSYLLIYGCPAYHELGMDHYEVRKFTGWHHHMLTCMLAHFFLWHLKIRLGKKSTVYYAIAD